MNITIKCEGLAKEEAVELKKKLRLLMRKRKRSNMPRFLYKIKMEA